MTRSTVLSLLSALVAGLLFGAGLAVSRMIDPQKVKDFLDIAAIRSGGWDPSLAFVMAGAVATSFIAFRIGRAPHRTLFAGGFRLPDTTGIDLRLVGGSAIFGIGWGIAGLCPGPAITDLGIAPASVLPYVLGMVAGSWGTGIVLSRVGGPRSALIDAATD